MTTRPIRVALDAMGGDHGLAETAAGAAQLSREDAPIHIILVGDEPQITAALAGHRYDPGRVEVVHAPGAPIAMAEDARAALEARPDCSIAVAARLVAAGEAEAVVSAGHTGATILSAARTFQRLPGVRRCALAAVHPTEQKHGPKGDPFALMLDVGATIGASAEDLLSFAVMGSAYAQVISDNERPSLALLSNGVEPNKGTPEIREAHRLLSAAPGLRFHGNVEGLDIPRGTVDIIVCDGFLGNVVLKMLEGVTEVVSDIAKDAYARRFLWKLGLTMVSRDLQQLRQMTDWKQYGGAPVLGFDQVVIKAHGRSNARAIRNAVKVAAKAVDRGLVRRTAEGIAAVMATSDRRPAG